MRLMFENSTVCHSRRINVVCPSVLLGLFFRQYDSGLIVGVCLLGIGFSTESLILAQDERWRRA